MFFETDKVYLEALDNNWADDFSKGVNSGVTSQYTFTGSVPMRQIDIQKVWEDERKAGSIMWSILPKGSTVSQWSLGGVVGLHSHRDIYRSWEFRIFLCRKDIQGKGIGEEVTRIVTQYAFERLNAHRVWGGTHADNIGMQKCFLKAGYKEEGRLREELFCFGKYADAIRYGILEDEWKSRTSVAAGSAASVTT